jgi:ribosomal protein L5
MREQKRERGATESFVRQEGTEDRGPQQVRVGYRAQPRLGRVVVQRSLGSVGFRGNRRGGRRTARYLLTGRFPHRILSRKGWATHRMREGDPVSVKVEVSHARARHLRGERYSQAGPEEQRLRLAGAPSVDGQGNWRVPLGNCLETPAVAPHWRELGRLQGATVERYVGVRVNRVK